MKRAKTVTITTPTDCQIVIERVFDAPRPLVFEAWTNPRYVPLWLLGPEGWTMPVCEIDLRPGGVWHFVWRQVDGPEMDMRGVYREVKVPERIVSTESWGKDWPETVNTIVMVEENGSTRVTNTIVHPSKEARDAALRSGMEQGVAASYDRLESLLIQPIRSKTAMQYNTNNSPRITPFLWFDNNAAEAVSFYRSVFDNTRKGTEEVPPANSVTIDFELDGQRFIALNGGPNHKFNDAVSFCVRCDSQHEIDEYWSKLSAGGSEGRCGWLKDKFGLSWQIVPSQLSELLTTQSAVQAMMKMKKLDIAELERAAG